MIAHWMLYALIVGALVSVAAGAIDRVLRALGRPTRWIWIGALVLCAAWPAYATLRVHQMPAGDAVAVSPLSATLQRATAVAARAWASTFRISLDTLLIAGWLLGSLVFAARLSHGVREIAARRRAWRTKWVDGVRVQLSRDVGPAIVGLTPMEVVFPAWALALDAPLRAIVLRHEEEHRRAGDPFLLVVSALLIVAMPWNAAVWWQARRLRLAIELDCDARVLGADPQPERYGLLLLTIAQRRSAAHARLVASLLEPVHHLEQRIHAMSRGTTPFSLRRIAGLTALALAAIAVACNVDAPPAPTSPAGASAGDPAAAQVAHYEFQVAQPALWIQGTGAPRYPQMLRTAGIEGSVLASFVVDVNGRADLSTFRVLKSSQDLFAVSIRNALPEMRFEPAEITGGRKVRQLLQQEFSFMISR